MKKYDLQRVEMIIIKVSASAAADAIEKKVQYPMIHRTLHGMFQTLFTRRGHSQYFPHRFILITSGEPHFSQVVASSS